MECKKGEPICFCTKSCGITGISCGCGETKTYTADGVLEAFGNDGNDFWNIRCDGFDGYKEHEAVLNGGGEHRFKVDMETASIAHVCYVNSIPFAAIRSMSDTPHESGNDAFQKYGKAAAEKSVRVLTRYLDAAQDK